MSTGRSLAICALAASTLPCWGCGLTPLSHRKLRTPPATVRARTISEGRDADDPRALTGLVVKLEDEDPVVRMAAHEELRERTGRDFGYVAWAGAEERAAAVVRWRSYIAAVPPAAIPIRTAGMRPSEAARRPARRRRARARDRTATTPPSSPSTTPTTEGAAS